MSWILLSCSPVEKTESGAAAVKNGVSQLPAHFNLIGVHHVRFTSISNLNLNQVIKIG